jgi:hypothetical protein
MYVILTNILTTYAILTKCWLNLNRWPLSCHLSWEARPLLQWLFASGWHPKRLAPACSFSTSLSLPPFSNLSLKIFRFGHALARSWLLVAKSMSVGIGSLEVEGGSAALRLPADSGLCCCGSDNYARVLRAGIGRARGVGEVAYPTAARECTSSQARGHVRSSWQPVTKSARPPWPSSRHWLRSCGGATHAPARAARIWRTTAAWERWRWQAAGRPRPPWRTGPPVRCGVRLYGHATPTPAAAACKSGRPHPVAAVRIPWPAVAWV